MIKSKTSLARLRKSQIITLEAILCNMEEQRSDVGPRAIWLTKWLFAQMERKKKLQEAREKEEKKEERKKEEKKKESEEKMEK